MRNNTPAIMTTMVVGLMIGYWGPFSVAVARQSAPAAPEEGGDDGAVLAWIRFEKAEKTYAEIPYLWLGDVNINLKADAPYEGKLVFDKPRHQVQMHLPIDYPRINQFPEWFTAKAERSYAVRNVASNTEEVHSGKRLQEGIGVELAAGEELRLEVAVAP